MSDPPALRRPPFLPPMPIIALMVGFGSILVAKDWRLAVAVVAFIAIAMGARFVVWLKSAHSEWAQEKFRAEREMAAHLFRKKSQKSDSTDS